MSPLVDRGVDERTDDGGQHDRVPRVEADVGDTHLHRRLLVREPCVEVDHATVEDDLGVDEHPLERLVGGGRPEDFGRAGALPLVPGREPVTGITGIVPVGERRVRAEGEDHRKPVADAVQDRDTLLARVDADVHVASAHQHVPRRRPVALHHRPVTRFTSRMRNERHRGHRESHGARPIRLHQTIRQGPAGHDLVEQVQRGLVGTSLGLQHLLLELLLDPGAFGRFGPVGRVFERPGRDRHRYACALVDQEQLLLDAESPHQREGSRPWPVLVSERAMVYD